MARKLRLKGSRKQKVIRWRRLIYPALTLFRIFFFLFFRPALELLFVFAVIAYHESGSEQNLFDQDIGTIFMVMGMSWGLGLFVSLPFINYEQWIWSTTLAVALTGYQ